MEKNTGLTEMQLRHQQQMKEKRDTIKSRKARTHRLIVRGAMAEKVIEGAESMTDEQFQAALYKALGKVEIATSNPQDSVGRPLRENLSEESCGSNSR